MIAKRVTEISDIEIEQILYAILFNLEAEYSLLQLKCTSVSHLPLPRLPTPFFHPPSIFFHFVQLNWFMDDLIFPNSDPALVSEVSSLCVELELILSNISSIQSNFTNITNITVDCNLTIVTEALTCLATPSDWTYKGGQGVYFPYAWAIEGNLISQEDAQAIVVIFLCLAFSIYMYNE